MTFVCTITVMRSSSILAWSSDEYIGSNGDRLEFISIEAEGTNRTARQSQTVAKLVGVSRGLGWVTLVSELRIQVPSSVQVTSNESITCHDAGNGVNNSISFLAIGIHDST